MEQVEVYEYKNPKSSYILMGAGAGLLTAIGYMTLKRAVAVSQSYSYREGKLVSSESSSLKIGEALGDSLRAIAASLMPSSGNEGFGELVRPLIWLELAGGIIGGALLGYLYGEFIADDEARVQ